MLEKINDLFDPLDQEAELLSDWQEDMMYDPEATEKFVKKSLCRHQEKRGIPLQTPAEIFAEKQSGNFLKNQLALLRFPLYFRAFAAFRKTERCGIFTPVPAGCIQSIFMFMLKKEG